MTANDFIAFSKINDVRTLNIKLSWILDKITTRDTLFISKEKPKNFATTVLYQQRLVAYSWIFKLGRYGNLCFAAQITSIAKSDLSYIFKSGPSVIDILNHQPCTSTESHQHILLDFWCETGYCQQAIEHLRNWLQPLHPSLIYFRHKNGKRIAKIITRDDATTFMRSRKAVPDDDGLAFLQTPAARDFYLPTYNTQMTFAQHVGEMALLMVHAPVAAVSPLKPVLERIQTCSKLEQHKLYSCASNISTDAPPTGNTPTGLVTWAWLTSKRLRSESFDTNALQAFEWSEGPHLAVVDMVLSPDTEAAVWADLAGLLYPEEDIWLLCKVGERVFFKKWAKHQRKELLTNPRARSAIAFGTWHDITQEATCPH